MALRAGLHVAPEALSPSPVAQGPALSVDGLSVRLGGREVLHDVSFSVAAGEVTGLIGMNGAGKTTLLRALLGLQPISAGKVSMARPGPAASPPATCHKRWCLTQTCQFAPATWSNWASTAGVSASRCGQVTNGPSSNICWLLWTH